MPLRSRRLSSLAPAVALLAFAATGCSDATGPRDLEGVAFLVGTWQADSLVATAVADANRTENLLAGGASFSINVQPSGQYTATLTVFGFPSTEIGRLTLEGTSLTLYREFPSADTASATLTQLGPDRVRLLGATTFQFSPTIGPEEASLLAEMVRQGS